MDMWDCYPEGDDMLTLEGTTLGDSGLFHDRKDVDLLTSDEFGSSFESHHDGAALLEQQPDFRVDADDSSVTGGTVSSDFESETQSSPRTARSAGPTTEPKVKKAIVKRTKAIRTKKPTVSPKGAEGANRQKAKEATGVTVRTTEIAGQGLDIEKVRRQTRSSYSRRCREKLNDLLSVLLTKLPPPPDDRKIKHKHEILLYAIEILDRERHSQNSLAEDE